ncbi:H-NS family nucleoid-associated regulatory protein [Acinetobacter sp. Marseille-P8610]|uniref:H-NS histone family protein n=1 Tax=Acinetobacter sp. Marseille-P8610 TaxID=2864459 RepID=UPI001CE42E27|nr:H-NS histone family protein [Acinetobacter sp. Marseille-P8610]
MTSKFDLENYSEVELGELIKEAEKLKASKAVQTKINAYEQLLEIAKGVELSLDELIQFGQENSKKEPKKVVEPKYRNKTNPDETWTGRGKHPKWLVNELANGKNLSDFLI